jgi:hypothetical protein
MTAAPLRALALTIMSAAGRLGGAQLQTWVAAMEGEVAEIEHDGSALAFALGCVWAVGSIRVGRFSKHTLGSPTRLGVVACITSTLIGVAYLAIAGAPPRYAIINLSALALGLGALPVTRRLWSSLHHRTALSLFLAFLMAVTALAGVSVEGSSRWLQFGPLLIQTSLIALPLLLVAAGGLKSRIIDVAIVVGAFGVAMQADVALTLVITVGALYRLVILRDHSASLAAASCCLAAATAALVYTPVSYSPFVDVLVIDAVQTHPWIALAILVCLWLLLAPAAVTGSAGEGRARLAMFSIGWMGIIVAATVGQGPTPIVGYGGTAIIGYLLSLSAMPRRAELMSAEGLRVQAPGERRLPLERSALRFQ